MLKIETRPHGKLTILKLGGDLDLDGAIKLKETIQEVRQSGSILLLFNFAEVKTVNSSVLQNLVTPIRALTLIKGKAAFCQMSPAVRKFMEKAMFFSIVKVYETEEEAVTDLTQEPGKKS